MRRVFKPELYQGPSHVKHTGYFEGWYFKAAFPHGALAVIPGVSLAPRDAHAFVQTLYRGESRYHRFRLDEFDYGTREFSVRVGGNRFSLTDLTLRLPEIDAELRISSKTRWPGNLLAPSSMGWYAYMRFMECYHGVIVLDGLVHGRLNARDDVEGRFYLEKDWGSSFPKGWIWLQSNSFERPASITCSVALVPFRNRVFTGFIAGLWDGRILHRFATYTGARVSSVVVGERSVELTIRDSTKTLKISAARAAGGELVSPIRGAMQGRITESLDAEISVELLEGESPTFEGTGVHAGLEVVNPEVLYDSK